MIPSDLVRYAAFTRDPNGGNPAGVLVRDELPSDTEMQAIAADVGYSECAFLAPLGDGRWRTRYFAPQAEVPFCGHASIAAGVELGRRHGPGQYVLVINDGEVPVEVTALRSADRTGDVSRQSLTGGDVEDPLGPQPSDAELDPTQPTDDLVVTLISVDPWVQPADDDLVERSLVALRWDHTELADDAPPSLAFAGARHLVLVLRSRDTLAALDYDFDALSVVAADHKIVTFQLAWPESPSLWHVRNPFPHGGVVEDPATGAAAAALGAYVRHYGLVDPPTTLELHQGADMGRPSHITVDVLAADVDARIRVSGNAVVIS